MNESFTVFATKKINKQPGKLINMHSSFVCARKLENKYINSQKDSLNEKNEKNAGIIVNQFSTTTPFKQQETQDPQVESKLLNIHKSFEIPNIYTKIKRQGSIKHIKYKEVGTQINDLQHQSNEYNITLHNKKRKIGIVQKNIIDYETTNKKKRQNLGSVYKINNNVMKFNKFIKQQSIQLNLDAKFCSSYFENQTKKYHLKKSWKYPQNSHVKINSDSEYQTQLKKKSPNKTHQLKLTPRSKGNSYKKPLIINQILDESQEFNQLNREDYQKEIKQTSIQDNLFRTEIPAYRLANELVVSLRTPLHTLKEILIQSGKSLNLSFMMPSVLMKPPSREITNWELHQTANKAYNHVGINPQILQVRKYINCVMMSLVDCTNHTHSEQICILWHFNNKVYFGGWNNNTVSKKIFGVKQGLGLQKVPSSKFQLIKGYAYYGQFVNDIKQGYGVMKKVNGQIYIGCWKNGQRHGWGKVYDPNGKLVYCGDFESGRLIDNSFKIYQ